MSARNIVVLGSTGSIGEQTLDVAAQFPDRVNVVGLAANRNLDRLLEQSRRFPSARVVLVDPDTQPPPTIEIGEAAMIELACGSSVDMVVSAIVGSGGLHVTLAALSAGKLVALANKEALVMAGLLIKKQLTRAGTLIPIDSEHSAIWQCLQGEPVSSVEKIVLTASGGALRDLSSEQLSNVKPAEALAHPTWSMGPKVTIDSATLMNKGLEVMEAAILFDLPMDRVSVVMHRESIVHSFVCFVDSSVKAQLALPDMRLPIQYALTHPDRWPNASSRLDISEIGVLTFGPVEDGRYPCLDLALQAGRQGGTYPAVLCAADEVAVELFLAGAVPFTSIPNLVADTLERHVPSTEPELADIIAADAFGRAECSRLALGAGTAFV